MTTTERPIETTTKQQTKPTPVPAKQIPMPRFDLEGDEEPNICRSID